MTVGGVALMWQTQSRPKDIGAQKSSRGSFKFELGPMSNQSSNRCSRPKQAKPRYCTENSDKSPLAKGGPSEKRVEWAAKHRTLDPVAL